MCYKLINGLNHSDQRHMKDFSLVNFINTVQLTISNKYLALKILNLNLTLKWVQSNLTIITQEIIKVTK